MLTAFPSKSQRLPMFLRSLDVAHEFWMLYVNDQMHIPNLFDGCVVDSDYVQAFCRIGLLNRFCFCGKLHLCAQSCKSAACEGIRESDAI